MIRLIDSTKIRRLKLWLTGSAAAVLALSAVLHWLSSDHLLSAVNPIFYYFVCVIGTSCCVWLAWQLYSGQGFWYGVLGKLIVVPVSAVWGLMFFDSVASKLTLLGELSTGSYVVQVKEHKVLRLGRFGKGRGKYAAIASLSTFDGKAHLPISEAQYKTYTEMQPKDFCLLLPTHTSQSGAVWVTSSDTEQVKIAFRTPCS